MLKAGPLIGVWSFYYSEIMKSLQSIDLGFLVVQSEVADSPSSEN